MQMKAFIAERTAIGFVIERANTCVLLYLCCGQNNENNKLYKYFHIRGGLSI